MSQIERFNLRVYALLLNPLGQILITREKLGDREFYKFPGGGLELGEGRNRARPGSRRGWSPGSQDRALR